MSADTSTGLVVAAGALSLADRIVTDWNPRDGVRICVFTVLAAGVSLGLNRVASGLGTGVAAVALTTVVFTSGPRLVEKLHLTS